MKYSLLLIPLRCPTPFPGAWRSAFIALQLAVCFCSSIVFSQEPLPTVSISFTALALGNQPINGWVYRNGKNDVPFQAFNFSRSLPYKYSGPATINFYIPSNNPEVPPQRVASISVASGVQELFLLFVPKNDKEFDVLSIDAASFTKIDNGYFFINLLKDSVRIRLGQQQISLSPGTTAPAEAPALPEGQSLAIQIFRMSPSTKANTPFFSSMWSPALDLANIVILADVQGKPQVYSFPEAPSRRRALKIQNETSNPSL